MNADRQENDYILVSIWISYLLRTLRKSYETEILLDPNSGNYRHFDVDVSNPDLLISCSMFTRLRVSRRMSYLNLVLRPVRSLESQQKMRNLSFSKSLRAPIVRTADKIN